MTIEIKAFADRAALTATTADIIAAALTPPSALAAPRARSFVATGGSTPGPVYDALAKRDLDWAGVTVTLTDERWVDPASPLSNEGLIRARLLIGPAAAAGFLPLKGAGATPHVDALAAEPALAALAPFDVVLLGMGPDGHIASLFPDDPSLAVALDPVGERLCVGVDHAGLEPFVPRISLTARALLNARLIVLLVTGEDKRALIARVIDDPEVDLPVAAIGRQSKTPVRILWAR